MAEHRVPMLSASLRRYPDPETSGDARIFTLVSQLRQLEVAPPPRAHFRAELRAQLVAVTPRLVAEGPTPEIVRVSETTVHTAPKTARSLNTARPRRLAALFDLSLGRPLAIVTAMVAVFALVLGGAVWMSKKALPGDALYSLKRANENVQLSLADGSTAKSKAYLDFAGERIDEVSALLKHASAAALGPGATASAGVSSHTASLVRSTLDSADSDVKNASTLLGNAAVANKSSAPLGILISWAPSQLSKLQAITDRLPAGSLHDRAAGSGDLVRSALIRAQNLSSLTGCSCLGSAASDALGPVPCSPCTTPGGPNQPPLPGLPTVPGLTPPTSTPTPGVPVPGLGTGTAGAGSGSAGGGSSSAGGGTSGGGGLGVTVPPLPTLPTIPLPTITLFPTHPKTTTSTTKAPATTPTTCIVNLLGLCVHL